MIQPKKISPVIAIIAIIVIVYIISLVVSAGSSGIDRKKCPYKEEGNFSANFVVKYIDSPFCSWCWLEEGVLKNLLAKKGDSFKLEKYDIRYCTDIVAKYKISGTPGFIFSINKTNEYTHVGYIKAKDFDKIICEVTGNCS